MLSLISLLILGYLAFRFVLPTIGMLIIMFIIKEDKAKKDATERSWVKSN